MIAAYTRDGERYDKEALSNYGFFMDDKRDFREVSVCHCVMGEKTGNTEQVFDFVGFVSNDQDDLLVVFPKHYKVVNKEQDGRKLFTCIARHMQRRPELYIGEDGRERYASNYPFAAFFGIYDYFQTYGLYFEDKIFVKPNAGGRISWKETISRGEKYIIGKEVVPYPFYYRKSNPFAGFMTDCMIYAIDYTVSKFGVLIDAQETGQELLETALYEDGNYVVNVLFQLKQQIFQDRILALLDDLIAFFSKLKIGGSYYLKHYSFSSIWEEMVADYLCKYYKEVNGKYQLVFDKRLPSGLRFKKRAFHVNLAKPEQYISPDDYGEVNDVQLIFDAKYYTAVNGMDYKQIAYLFLLREMTDPVTKKKKFSKTYAALILPSESRSTKLHFQIDPVYSNGGDFVITEEYLDIREVLEEYLGS